MKSVGRILLLAGSVVLCSAAAAWSGPFGIEMGDSIDKYDVAQDGFKPRLKSAPKPHPLFVSYSVWHSPKTGICRIVGISEVEKQDGYGRLIREKSDRIRSALVDLYGEGKGVDFLKPDAFWSNDYDWAMSIKQNQRTFAHYWENPQSSSGAEYSLIQLWIEGLSRTETVLLLEYRSTDFETCQQEIAKEKESPL